jgi:tRNA(fMet)-specific endonuclease VapC
LDPLQFAVLEFDKEDARQAGKIGALLASKGTPIDPCDVLIAGQAMARSMVLVTREYRRIRAYPWAAAGRLAGMTLVERFRLVIGPLPW